MKLYVGVLSLFSAKARIALAEKGVEPELVYVGWSREGRYLPHHPDVLALNPKAQVPVLVDGDVVVCDSTQILEYLEDRVPEPPLQPRDVAERARCRALESAGDEIWFPCVWDLIEGRFYGDDPARSAVADEAVARLGKLYSDLDKELVGRSFLLGDAFTTADVSVFMQVQAAMSLGAPPGESHSGVRDWVARVSARPSVAPVLREMTQAAAEALAPSRS